MLRHLSTQHVEPVRELDVELAPRLNLLSGDNGLGKTFLLDLAWYALTTSWRQNEVIPIRGEGTQPCIRYAVAGAAPVEAKYNFERQWWQKHWPTHPDPVLVLYANADGGFDLEDTYRTSGPSRTQTGGKNRKPSRFSLSRDDVWNGLLSADGTAICNGLIRDWIAWQFQRPALFDLFTRVIATLSPHPDEVIQPGPPRRVSIDDARDIPTLMLPYGTVPVTHASAGMRRILSLAYMLVWAWHEHTEAARLRNTAPLDELMLLIDEVDAHLHPQWQRVILPALFKVIPAIHDVLQVQVLASTHAPLVLASVEPIFDEACDKLLHFGLRENRIVVEEIPWSKQGDAANWLVSETFGLQQARSREAERAIEAAEAFMRGESTPPDLDTKETIHAELLRVLPGHDDFWPRWLVETGAVK